MKHSRWFIVASTAAITLALSACVPSYWLLPKLGVDTSDLSDFGPGFEPPISVQTGEQVNGFGGNGGGLHRTPLILVHGTTMPARSWKKVREYFKAQGYTDDELWAVGYGWGSGRYPDSAPMSAVTLDSFVEAVLAYLSKKHGRELRQVDIIGHSLGVMVVRHWIKQANAFDRVRSYVAVAGFNHIDEGLPIYPPDGRGPNRESNFILATGSPWLIGLNHGGDVPGPTRYMTLYDGTGWGDIFYPPPFQDSPRLEGAYNLAYNRERGTLIDHIDVMFKTEPLDEMNKWLVRAREPLPVAEPPQLVQEGAILKTNAADALVHCANGDSYPTAATPGVSQVNVSDGRLYTCYAKSQRSELPSRLQRFKQGAAAPASTALTLAASPPAGIYEQPQLVHLTASDLGAYIVYSVVTEKVNTGSPLYSPDIGVYITSPLTLTAQAYAPDGRVSEPLTMSYNISMEMVDANRTLERQVDPKAPLKYKGNRSKGR